MESVIGVKYKIRKEYCHCCGRGFDKDEEHEEKTTDVDVAELLSNVEKTEDNEVYAEDFMSFVDDFLFDTFNYWITSGEVAFVEKEESEKVLKKAYELLKKTDTEIIGEEILRKYLAI